MSEPAKYKRKIDIVDAIQWVQGNNKEVNAFIAGAGVSIGQNSMRIQTLAGVAKVVKTDWILKDWQGNLFPMNHVLFEGSYEKVEDE